MKWISASKACQMKSARRRVGVDGERSCRERRYAVRRMARVEAREARVVASRREGVGVGMVVVVDMLMVAGKGFFLGGCGHVGGGLGWFE
jgi:hypothetical protein